MTYHPTLRDRYVYLMILTVCIGLVGFSGFKVLQGAESKIGSWGQALGVTSFLTALASWLNWEAWRVSIRVDERGLEWKDGRDQGALTWEEIRGIGYKQYPKFAKPGLVLRSSPELKFLPFFSPALYAALRERCGRLPAEIEKSLGFRS
jgi:hypothetical protein